MKLYHPDTLLSPCHPERRLREHRNQGKSKDPDSALPNSELASLTGQVSTDVRGLNLVSLPGEIAIHIHSQFAQLLSRPFIVGIRR